MELDLNGIDDSIHSRVRLGILAHLVSVGVSNFQTIKRVLGVSDGNLGTHLGKLEQAGHVTITKSFVGKKPLTEVALTPEGRAALMSYLNTVQSLIDHIGKID